MSSILEVRKYFGLSQKDLAVYLSVSESLLKKAELQQRSLPTNAFVLLAKLQETMQSKNTQLVKKHNVKNKSNNNIEFKLLQKLRDETKIKAIKAQIQLDRIQLKQLQAINLIKMVTQLKKQPKKAISKAEDLWHQVQEVEANKTINKNSIETRLVLEWKISCYKFAIEKVNELLKSNTL